MLSNWQNTPAATLLRFLADLMLVNLLTLVCSMGIVTMGASLTAMYAVLFRRERDEGTVDVLRTYFRAFARSFVKATALELMVALLALVEFTMSFPQLAAFENTLGNYVKNSLLLAACAPVHLLGILAAWAIPWGLALAVPELFARLGYLYLLWGIAFPAWLTVKLLNLVFQKTNQAQPNPPA